MTNWFCSNCEATERAQHFINLVIFNRKISLLKPHYFSIDLISVFAFSIALPTFVKPRKLEVLIDPTDLKTNTHPIK